MASGAIYDLVVIGCGTSGIVQARFYLDVHPGARVAIIEKDKDVGGTWSRERVYIGFKSQGSVRMGGFSDRPLTPEADQIDENDFYAAEAMSAYLEEYVDDHVYSGKTIRDRISFDTKVVSLERIATGWRVNCETQAGPRYFDAPKIVIASGSTSTANMPNFRGREAFVVPIIHTTDFGRSKILQQEHVKTIAVIGGGKSAADMAYQAVKAGKEVHWIIRRSGKGPGSFGATKIGTNIWRNVTELTSTRIFTGLFEFPGLDRPSWWERFILKTRLGQWLFKKMLKSIGQRILDSARYDDRPSARASFSKLKNPVVPFTFSAPIGTASHEDFWDTIARHVEVHREDIAELSESSILLDNGEKIIVDGILCGTGFKEGCYFLTAEQQVALGLPHPESLDDANTAKEWQQLNSEAEKIVRERYFSLDPPPTGPENLGDISPTDTPYRLYNCIAPIRGDRSIAFVGFGAFPNNFLGSEVSAIWATAYLDGTLSLPSEAEMKRDVAYVTTYMRLRFPTYGRLGNFYDCDMCEQIDRMLRDLCLMSHKKTGWKAVFTPLVMSDLAGLKDEYLRKYGEDEAVTLQVTLHQGEDRKQRTRQPRAAPGSDDPGLSIGALTHE